MVHEIDKSAVVTAVNEAYTQYAKTTEGQNASYIPYLKVGSINSIFYFLHKAAEPFNCLEQDNLTQS